MTNVDNPHGLTPVGHLFGLDYNAGIHPYFVNSAYGTGLFIGDAVTKTGTANTAKVSAIGAGDFPIATLPEVILTAAGDGNPLTGVVVGVFPITRDSDIFSPASTQSIVMVCDDPYVLFRIQANGIIAPAQIGLNAVLIYTHAGSTITGISGAELDTTSDAPAADASNQLTILRQANVADNDTELTHPEIMVRINNHTEAHGAVGI